MARPLKEGLSYWPRDVGFLRDKKVKMVKSNFGTKGVYILERLFDLIYEDKGYFKVWDEEDCLLMSEEIGDDRKSNLITDVVNECVKRSLFDKRIFDLFGVLTSKGIQKRYLTMVAKRERIPIVTEYWLLPKEEISASVLLKCVFSSVSGEETAVSVTETPVSVSVSTQSKGKQSKTKQSKAEQSKLDCIAAGRAAAVAAAAAAEEASSPVFLAYKAQTGRAPSKEHQEELAIFRKRLSEGLVLEGFKRAAERGGQSWAYTKRILEDWDRKGIRSIEAAQAEQRHGKQTVQQSVQIPEENTEQMRKDMDRMDRLLQGLKGVSEDDAPEESMIEAEEETT